MPSRRVNPRFLGATGELLVMLSYERGRLQFLCTAALNSWQLPGLESGYPTCTIVIYPSEDPQIRVVTFIVTISYLTEFMSYNVTKILYRVKNQ